MLKQESRLTAARSETWSQRFVSISLNFCVLGLQAERSQPRCLTDLVKLKRVTLSRKAGFYLGVEDKSLAGEKWLKSISWCCNSKSWLGIESVSLQNDMSWKRQGGKKANSQRKPLCYVHSQDCDRGECENVMRKRASLMWHGIMNHVLYVNRLHA